MAETDLFFRTFFQEALEEAQFYFLKPCEESKPFEHKYKANEILLALEKHPSLEEETEDAIAGKAIVNFFLSQNYYEVEENAEAETRGKAALTLLTQISSPKVILFLNYAQKLYNFLALLLVNRGEFQQGLSLLAKAKELYDCMK